MSGGDPAQRVEIADAKRQLHHVMRDALTHREQEIVKLRYGIGDGYTYTLEEVARMFNVTRERVRQIEAKAIRKLRRPGLRFMRLKEMLNTLADRDVAIPPRIVDPLHEFMRAEVLYGYEQMARTCRMSCATMQNWVAAGLPVQRLRRGIAIQRRDFIAWLRAKLDVRRDLPACRNAGLRKALGALENEGSVRDE